MKHKTVFIGIVAVAGAVAIGLFILKKVHIVDSAPAVAVANEYLSDMQQGKVDDAFGLYTGQLRQRLGDKWKKGFMAKMPTAFGPVRSYSVESERVVPVKQQGCYLLRYEVHRTLVNSKEGFLVCPADGPKWEIIGYKFNRTDTGQHLVAGIMPVVVGVHIP